MNNRWLITGVAGFIGSNLLEELLQQGCIVTGLDNFSTGSLFNLTQVKDAVGVNWKNFTLIEGDICNFDTCCQASKNVDYISHHAAMISVAQSIENPTKCIDVNVKGFINILNAASANNVKKLIYASSSAIYGNCPNLPLTINSPTNPISPYGISKLTNEQFAYISPGVDTIGLRYMNVYGPRQNTNSGYAAVIPMWIEAALNNTAGIINGTGETVRDFVHVRDVVFANLNAINYTTNLLIVGSNTKTSLTDLYKLIQEVAVSYKRELHPPINSPFRYGDVLQSFAISNTPVSITLKNGIENLFKWYLAHETNSINN